MDSPLLQRMLTDAFRTEEEQTFIKHFQLYAQYGNDKSQHVIDIDLIWKWLGFSKLNNAKRMLVKHFTKNIDFTSTCLLLPPEQQRRGGHNKETIKMSVDTFKKFCMKARTDQGDITREYYIRMEEVLFEYMKDVLKKEYDARVNSLETQIRRDNEITHQKSLIIQNDKKQCVYVFRVSDVTETNEYIVRFGKTCDIKTRAKHHAQSYDVCVLLDVIATSQEHKLEQHILRRPMIMRRRIPKTESLKLDSEFTLKHFTTMIRESARRLEESTLSASEILHMSSNSLKERVLDMDIDDNIKATLLQQIEVPLPKPTPPTDLTPRFRRVYKYAPDNLTMPIETFNSLREAARSTNTPYVRDYHIRDAVNLNTVVADHRWFFVDESEENPSMNPPAQIPDTFLTPEIKQISSLIAQLCQDKKQVLKVHKSIKDAAASLDMHACSITVAKQTKQKSRGFFWVMWDDLDDELRATYTDPIPEPSKHKTSSKRILQKDPDTLEVIQEYACFQDVVTKFRICHKKLNKLCDSGEIYKGFVWALVQD